MKNQSMIRDQAIAEIALSTEALRARSVEAAYLFGSTARGEARPDSDLDVFIDIAPDARFSLLDLAGLHRLLNESIGRKVDVTTRESLHPKLRGEIERGAVRVF
ncbi:MAG: nucleotidyltransferase domain-containing protein [Afipia sp.]|nr:nucleotidyltransferase domain-containing protein [Afipia sp.]